MENKNPAAWKHLKKCYMFTDTDQFGRKRTIEQVIEYMHNIQNVELCMGSVNVLIFCCMLMYIVYSLMMKHKKSTFVWISMSLLCLDSASIGFA